jgi:hypothetical protein
MMIAPEHVESVRAGLEQYLKRNPGACDTLDGMVSCWLGGLWLPGLDRHGMWRLVGAAVEQLVAEGRLRRLAIHATEALYMDSIAELVPLELLLTRKS